MLDRTDASNCGERMDAGHHGQVMQDRRNI